MIERLLLPDRSGAVQQFIDAMRSRSFHALHDVDQWECPTVAVSERMKQQVNVIGHYHHSVEMNSLVIFAETVCKYQVPGILGKRDARASTESNEQRRIILLQMWKPPAVAKFAERWAGHYVV